MFGRLNSLVLGLVALPLLTLAFMYITPTPAASIKEEVEDGDHVVAAYESWVSSRMADPAMGKIPGDGLWQAYQQLMRDGRVSSTNRFTFNATRGTSGWQPVNDFFPSLSVTSICHDPSNTNIFYFSTGESYYGADEGNGAGIFKSTDGGATWAQLSSTNSKVFTHTIKMVVNPKDGYVYAATRDGIWRSKDQGSTWKQVCGQYGDRFSDVAFSKNGTMFASLGVFQSGGVYRSPSGDSGTWTALSGGGFPAASSIYFVTLATAPSTDSVIYAATCNASNSRIGGIYRSDNMGNTWHALTIPGSVDTFARVQAWYDLVVTVDPHNDSIVYAAGLDMWRSKNAGQSWFRLSQGDFFHIHSPYVHVDHHCAVFDGSNTLTVGCDGGIYRANNFQDSLPTFASKNYGYRVTQFYDANPDPRAGNPYVVGGTQDNGTPALLNNGLSTYRSESWGDGTFTAINFNNPNIRYTTREQNGQYRHLYNNPFDTITNPYVSNSNVQFVNPFIMDAADPEKLYMGSTAGVYRLDSASTASKKNWTPCTRRSGNISALSTSTDRKHILFIGLVNGRVLRVIGCDTTTRLTRPVNITGNTPDSANCNQVFVDPTNCNHAFAIFSNYGTRNIWETWGAVDSANVKWVCHDGDLPNLPVYGILPHPTQAGMAYIATELGMFYTAKLNGAATHWVPANNGLANVRVEEIKYRAADSTIYAVTHGRGIYDAKINLSSSGNYFPTWNERGPINVGGRTLALMIDPNDKTHQTLWAGSAGGGLWKINQIDSLHDPKTVIAGINPVPTPVMDVLVYPNPFTNSFTVKMADYSSYHLQVYDMNGQVIVETHFVSEYSLPSHFKLPTGIYYVCVTQGCTRTVKKIVCSK